MITIRRANMKDIPDIMAFIEEHWKNGHILARDRDFFEWQFVDDGKVNVYIGIDESGKIYGMEGVILYNHTENPDVSGSIWKTIRSDNPLLGIEIGEYLAGDLNVRCGCSAGMSKRALKIYEMLGYHACRMDHYYRLGDRDEYHIAKVEEKVIPGYEEEQYEMLALTTMEEFREIISESALHQTAMRKDYRYIEKRYFKHPVYSYEFFHIVPGQGKTGSILIMREECIETGRACKIIDFYGCMENFAHVTKAIDELVKKRHYEYVDVYSFGVPSDIYERAGFVCCDSTHRNVIPNYFHPFEQRNIDLQLINPMVENLRLFRGDGDQDRPS